LAVSNNQTVTVNLVTDTLVVEGRFAPSPTGELHVGNLRTALVAWLSARSAGGRFIVRMEDLDRANATPEHAAGQLRDLADLGMDWDGDVVFQSERFDRYRAVLAGLEAAGLTYPCFCSRREIREAAAAPHGEATYPGTCRDLTGRERAARAETRPPATRLRAGGAVHTVHDRIAGTFTGVADDIVLLRNDGVPAYHLAVVVDDADQGVTEVVRGDDLLPSTPSHLHLQQLLGFPHPDYLHVPLVLGPDGQRLAKRHGAVTLAEAGGPAAVLPWMGFSLGLAEPGETVSTGLLLDRFDPARIPRQPVQFGSVSGA
jgi:glutamyl-tRNA synthetase